MIVARILESASKRATARAAGRHCPLARFGHSRDERSGNPQIVFGLLTDAEGCPVAVFQLLIEEDGFRCER